MGEQLTRYLLELMGQLDYFAIFWLMAAESSILPVPSELVMIPAGYLVSTGQLSLSWVMAAGSAGSLIGSLGSYYLALWLGRPFLHRFGKYLLITEHHLEKTERFVDNHGEVSIFSGRFIPGIRHLVSMPAGLVRMRMVPFLLYTFLGSTLWNTVLVVLGYYVGQNQEWLKANGHYVAGGAVLFAALVIFGYVAWNRSRARA